jgi:hypothetical protein
MPDFHEYADAFPMLEDGTPEFEELVKDIETNGLTDPIVLFEDKILDGRNRWRACQKLGIPHREVKFENLKLGSDDPMTFVWSKNAVRRQLTTGQKALAAAALAKASAGRPRKNGSPELVTSEMTNEEAAKKTGTSASSIKRAKRVLDKASPKVVKAVQKGELPVSPAARLAEKPVAEQEEIMDTVNVADIPKLVPDDRWADGHVPGADAKPERKVTGGNRLRPLTLLKNQLKETSSVGERARVDFWTKHRALISKLPADELAEFVKDMGANRRYISQLLNLIKEETSAPGTAAKKAPAARAPRKTAAAKKDAAGTENKGS